MSKYLKVYMDTGTDAGKHYIIAVDQMTFVEQTSTTQVLIHINAASTANDSFAITLNGSYPDNTKYKAKDIVVDKLLELLAGSKTILELKMSDSKYGVLGTDSFQINNLTL